MMSLKVSIGNLQHISQSIDIYFKPSRTECIRGMFTSLEVEVDVSIDANRHASHKSKQNCKQCRS